MRGSLGRGAVVAVVVLLVALVVPAALADTVR
jgi:hypothetical protein